MAGCRESGVDARAILNVNAQRDAHRDAQDPLIDNKYCWVRPREHTNQLFIYQHKKETRNSKETNIIN